MIRKSIITLIVAIVLINLLLVSFWINLTTEKLTPWIAYHLNEAVPSKYEFQLNSAKSHLGGLTLNSLLLQDKSDNTRIFYIETLEFKVNPVSLILFRKVPFLSTVYEGEFEGSLRFFPTLLVEFIASNIRPNRNEFIRRSKLILSNPTLSMEGELNLSTPVNGQIKLHLKTLKLSGKMENTNLPFDLPHTNLTDLNADLILQKQQFKLSAQSKGDISGNLMGIVQMNPKNIPRSKLNLKLMATLDNEYQEKLGLFNQILSNLKNRAGQLSLRITGTATNPKVEKI